MKRNKNKTKKKYKYLKSVKNLWVIQSSGHRQSIAHYTSTETSQIESQIEGPMVMTH